MPETMIRPALPAQELAGPLIEEHHPHLTNARILWLYTTAKRKKCDRVRLASAKKLSALERFMSSGMESVDTGYDFLGLIGAHEWGGLTRPQQIALVDHELCHMAVFVKESGKWRRFDPRLDVVDDVTIEHRYGLRGHDLEEFAEVVARHGLWSADRQQFAEAIPRQLPLNATSEHDRKNAETVERLKAQATPNGTEHAGEDWRERTAVGASEHAQRRRSRARS